MSNLSLKEAVNFMKKTPKSAVWLERGTCKIFTDGCNGHSTSFDLSNTMFLFLKQSNLLKDNSYSGFKGYRIFDANVPAKFNKMKELEELYETYKKETKKSLMKNKKALELIISQTYEKQTQKFFFKKLEYLGIKDCWVRSPKGSAAGRVFVGNRFVTYFDWKTNNILNSMNDELARIKKVLKTEDYSEYISNDDYSRMPLSDDMEAKLAYIAYPFKVA